MSLRIETVQADNFEQVLPLIASYQEFYQRIPDEVANRRHFSQFLSGQHPLGIQFLAFDAEGRALGFATLYFLPSSLSAGTSCEVSVVALGQLLGQRMAQDLRPAIDATGTHAGLARKWHMDLAIGAMQQSETVAWVPASSPRC
ncbi:MAG: hypothetical protein U0931_25440 [Vulcanimicrobiota bacterium]